VAQWLAGLGAATLTRPLGVDLSRRGRGDVQAAAPSPLPWREMSAAQQPGEDGPTAGYYRFLALRAA
jgi:hypothetical protein